MARDSFPGKSNSLDALCKRFEVNNAMRELHGALLDAGLLAEVYVRMTRGQDSLVIDVGDMSAAELAARPVDFRKGMDGLAALVQQALRADPFAGDVFIFRAKRADRVKILVFDGTGLVLYAKRLEAGRFCWPSPADGVVRLTSAQLATLLEGLAWNMLRPRPVRRPSVAW